MQLTFKKPFLSIRDFEPTELPEFTLLTGLNGSGKSHLLKAIVDGSIQVDGQTTFNKNEVRLFDWTSLVPQDQGTFASQALKDQRFNLFSQTKQQIAPAMQKIVAAARSVGLKGLELADAKRVAEYSAEELGALLGDAEKGRVAHKQIESIALEESRRIIKQVGNEHQKIELQQMSETLKKPVFLLDEHDFATMSVPWGQTDIFQQSFAQMFVAYLELWRNNQLRRLANMDGRTDVSFLSQEEFFRAHKTPPWEFVNQTLQAAGLNFEINHPDEFGDLPFEPILTKRSSGAQIKFADLSSGEKIIMSFALCVYYADDKRQTLRYPKLLLLDEVDAPLHPSMCRGFVNTITETLVKRHGIKVIATTHSPSTVAMAPEGAIFVMEAGKSGLQKSTKARAINVLTQGVPSLAIDYSGRRQVLVESPKDAEVYDKLYQTLRPQIQAERSLAFLQTSASRGRDHTNTGCDVVKRLVGDFRNNGNSSVFGLIDWDGSNDTSDRVFVLAQGKRDGLENVLFDPLLLAACIARDVKSLRAKIGIPGDKNYISFCGADAATLQSVVTAVVNLVLGSQATGTLVPTSYLGGLQLQVDEAYFKMDDHRLEAAVLGISELGSIVRDRGGHQLMMHIADPILVENPGFAPTDLVEAFLGLLNADNHVAL